MICGLGHLVVALLLLFVLLLLLIHPYPANQPIVRSTRTQLQLLPMLWEPPSFCSVNVLCVLGGG